MKSLVVYYSWTGNTSRVAGKLAELLKAETEEIRETRKRGRFFGYVRSGFEVIRKISPPIAELRHNPGDYDMVVIGTPVWAGTFASPVRSFLVKYGDRVKKTAFFLTMGGEKEARSLTEMSDIIGKQPLGTFSLRAKVVRNEARFEKEAIPAIRDFTKSLQSS